VQIVRDTIDKIGIAGELIRFLWELKLWWMIPLVLVLVMFGILIVAGSTSGVGPFIYTLF